MWLPDVVKAAVRPLVSSTAPLQIASIHHFGTPNGNAQVLTDIWITAAVLKPWELRNHFLKYACKDSAKKLPLNRGLWADRPSKRLAFHHM